MFDSERIVQHAWNVAGRQMGYGDLGYENMCHTIGFNVVRRQEYFLKKYGQNFPFEEFKERYREAYAAYVKAVSYTHLDVYKRQGMNFIHMPELAWKYAYPVTALVGVVLVILEILYFWKKKWF